MIFNLRENIMEFLDFYNGLLREVDDQPDTDPSIIPPMDRNKNKEDVAQAIDKAAEEGRDTDAEEEAEERKEEREKTKRQKLTPEDYSKARDKLVVKFNEENEENTNIRLAEFTPNENIPNAFKVIADIDKEEVYLDREKYREGSAPIVLSTVFYNDVLATAQEIGIVDIKWQENGRIGQVLLTTPATE